jgi:ATP-dependent Lon protease
MPGLNRVDIDSLPEEVRANIDIRLADDMEGVIKEVLERD